MVVEQLGPAACRSYLVGCERTREALLVDPLLDMTAFLEERLERDGWKLRFVADTHTHADHLSGGAALAERCGVPYLLHEGTENKRPTDHVRDGQVLEVGDARVEVIHTPGHTPDSVTLRCGTDLLTGDFLFLAQDGAGRLDLPGGDPEAHWDSLQRLAALGDELRVLPGHDYNELEPATLGVERRRNPRFQNVSREEYAAWQRAIAAPTPDWMLDVIAANLGNADLHAAHHAAQTVVDGDAGGGEGGVACAPGGGGACAAGPMFRVPMVFPAEARSRLEAQPAGHQPPFLLDVREPWEYAAPTGRHAPGAVLVPIGELPDRLDELPQDRERELLVICKSGGRSAAAAEFLIENGWRRVFNVATGTDGWVRSGLPVEN